MPITHQRHKAFRLKLADQLVSNYNTRKRLGCPRSLPAHLPPELPPSHESGPPCQASRTATYHLAERRGGACTAPSTGLPPNGTQWCGIARSAQGLHHSTIMYSPYSRSFPSLPLSTCVSQPVIYTHKLYYCTLSHTLIFVHFVFFVSFVSCMHTWCACMCDVTLFHVMCVWMCVYMCMCTACPCSIHTCSSISVWCVNIRLVLSGNTSRPPRGARW